MKDFYYLCAKVHNFESTNVVSMKKSWYNKHFICIISGEKNETVECIKENTIKVW